MNRPIEFPFRIDGGGRTAVASAADHVRQLVEQVLFTTPGERVNRPDFGTGLAGLVFEPADAELNAAVEYVVQAGLQRWLGEVIQVEDVSVTAGGDGSLNVTVGYLMLDNQERMAVTLTSGSSATVSAAPAAWLFGPDR